MVSSFCHARLILSFSHPGRGHTSTSSHTLRPPSFTVVFSFSFFENSDSTIRAARSSEKSTWHDIHITSCEAPPSCKTALKKERDALNELNGKAQQDPTWILLCSCGRKYSKRCGSPPLRVSRSQNTLRIDLKLNTRTYLNLIDIKLKLMMKSV